MRYACLFSGQGGQHPDMLAWLSADASPAAASLLVQVDARLGTGWRARLADLAWAGDNARAQLLLTALSLAALAPIAEALGPPALVAGYSVGELAAFAAAGVFDADTALDLARTRAACMDTAAEQAPGPTGLIGVQGRSPDDLQTLCDRHSLDLAIRSAPAQGVLGGLVPQLDAAAADAEAMGWHVTRLNVALASHTRWLRPAQPALAAALQGLPLRRPVLPLISNAAGRIHNADQARAALVRQLAETVRWDHVLDAVAEQQVDAVLEIGPGQALARMWTARGTAVPARSVDEFRSLPALLGWMRRRAA